MSTIRMKISNYHTKIYIPGNIINKIIEDEDKKIALSYSIDSNAVMKPSKFVLRDKK